MGDVGLMFGLLVSLAPNLTMLRLAIQVIARDPKVMSFGTNLSCYSVNKSRHMDRNAPST
jgi:hypothetical protein